MTDPVGALCAEMIGEQILMARHASRAFTVLALLMLVATCVRADQNCARTSAAAPDLATLIPADVPTSTLDPSETTRLVERRCVVCHGCYDAPCQLKLSSPDGLARGGSKQNVYDTARLTDARPTRLGVDATTAAGWRTLGFHPVTSATDPGASVMARLLALGRKNPFTPGRPLPEDLAIDTDDTLACPAPDEIEEYAAAFPNRGMPFGMAALSDSEFATLGRWILSGEPLPSRNVAIPDRIRKQVADWQDFLNTADPRGRLVSRYLYEHLFLAHLHFEGDAPDRFFRLVRSATPPGKMVREIATRRPFDDPGGPFSYRLIPVAETIVHKDHIVYKLSPRRMARLRSLFLQPGWTVSDLPPYGLQQGANPFTTFAAIPAQARYRFLLDDTLFFVRSFIRGPVCHGMVATDVVEDRFWVAFLDPDSDLSLTDPRFLQGAASLLKLPVSSADGTAFERFWPVLHDGHRAWLKYRDAAYVASPSHRDGYRLSDIWMGNGKGEATLTVFRNHDNASVVTGFVGEIPETAWIIDYPNLERIYYDLVAGYDVFGSVETQLTTRLYMDHLRREGEDLFLSFLPAPERTALHREWYRGPLSELHASWTARRADDRRPTAITYESKDPKAELLLRILERSGRSRSDDALNRCNAGNCAPRSTVETAISSLASRKGPWVRLLPDVSLVRVADADRGATVFTLFHDKAHSNVALLFGEADRREPADDIVTLLRGQVVSYPNFFFDVTTAEVNAFVDAVTSMENEADWLAVVERFGVRRTSPTFWSVSDALHDELIRQDAIDAGLLDLSRYRDPREGAGDE